MWHSQTIPTIQECYKRILGIQLHQFTCIKSEIICIYLCQQPDFLQQHAHSIKLKKSKFAKITNGQFKFYYSDTQWQGCVCSHYQTPHSLLPKLASRGKPSLTHHPFTRYTHLVVLPVFWNIAFRNLCKFSFT